MDTKEDINRLEAKIDKLAEAINRLVLVEDRQIRINSRIDKLDEDVSAAFSVIRETDAKVERLVSYGKAASWLAATAFTFLTGITVFLK